MAFSLSGSTITQTGTDTSLSGLGAIAGVTTIGRPAAAAAVAQPNTIYNLNALELVVNGNLSWDAKREELYFGPSTIGRCLRVNSGGSVTINGYYDAAGFTNVATLARGISVGRGVVGNWFATQTNYTIRAEAGSTFNLLGASISAPLNVFIAGGGQIRNGLILGLDTDLPLVAINNNAFVVNGLDIIGTHGIIFGANNKLSLSGVRARSVAKVTQHNETGWNTPAAATSFATLTDYVSEGISGDIRYWWHGPYKVRNSSRGSALDCASGSLASGPGSGFTLVTRDVAFKLSGAGTPVSNGLVFMRDRNNGLRRSLAQMGFTGIAGVPNLANDQTYLWQCNAAGVAASQEVYVAVHSAIQSLGDSDGGRWDYRSHSNSNADLFDFVAYSYAHQIASIPSQSLVGVGAKSIEWTMFADTNVTLTEAQAAALTTIDSAEKFYCRAKWFKTRNIQENLETNGIGNYIVTRSGNLIDAGSYNVTIDATAAQAFALAGNTLTIKASTYTGDMATTGIITLANGATFIGTRTDANGTIVPPKTVSITGITAGSRLRIYNNTTASEVVNQIVAGTSYSATYNEGTGYTTGDTLTITATWQSGATAKLPFSTQVVVGSTGWSALVAQQADAVYDGIGVDGSAVTEFSADYPNVQVDISDPNGQTGVDRLYSWFVHTTTTESGIRNWVGGIVAEDAANFRVVTSVVNLKLDNVSATGVEFTGGHRLYRDDGATPLVSSTTGGGSITLFAGKVYTSIVSTASPVITGDISQVPAAVQQGMTAQGYTQDEIAAIKRSTGLIPAAL